MDCLLCGDSCQVGGPPVSPHCGHFAGDACLREWVARQISWHVPPSRLRCFHEGCTCQLPMALSQEFVGEPTGSFEAPLDLSSQLTIEMLKRRNVPVNFLVLRSGSSARAVCPVCQTEHAVLVANEGCYHAACQDCWENRIESQSLLARDLCKRTLSVQCLEPNCTHIVGDHILGISSAYSRCTEHVASELKRLKWSSAWSTGTENSLLVYGDVHGSAGPECSVCHKHAFGLLENHGCCHRACEHCWKEWAEKHIDHCRNKCLPQLYASCIDESCEQMMAKDIVRHACTLSKPLMQFTKEMDAEVARLEKTASEILAWGSTESGPTCTFCNKLCLAVLGNAECCHVACEDCWVSWAESHVPRCRERLLADLYGNCIGKGCSKALGSDIKKHVYTCSTAIKSFKDDLQAELTRLAAVGDLLYVGSTPSEVGPECCICRERCMVLMTNGDCGHAACEDCWAKWAETQIPWCRTQRRANLSCFGPQCKSKAPGQLWTHSCSRNCHVQALETQFASRRRLQNNILYPAEVQVNCPQLGCVGLGYRGYDTLMCFLCEHQWTADNEDALPCVDVDIELTLGDQMKKCPGCGEFIIKNGGCDHMTCRCRHEFFWSTLLPYRTS